VYEAIAVTTTANAVEGVLTLAVEPMNPFEVYASKRCTQCGMVLEEQSECYGSTCDECEGNTFYPLSPLQPPGKPARFMQGCNIIDEYTL